MGIIITNEGARDMYSQFRRKHRRDLVDRARKKLLRGQSSAAETGALGSQRAPYNWIDIAMLIVSALTPLTLFGLGVVVTNASSQETLKREAAVRQETRNREDAAAMKAERREAQRAAEAIERDKYQREEARRDAQMARDEARRDAQTAQDEARRDARTGRDEGRRDAKAARDEAFARERVIQSDADIRADNIRRQAAQDERVKRLLEKRAQGWAVIGPLASKLDLSAQYFLDATKKEEMNKWHDEILYIDDEIKYKFSAHFFYFGPEFTQMMWKFTDSCLEFVEGQYKSKKEKQDSYQRLVADPFSEIISAAEIMVEDPYYSAPVSLD